MVIVDKTYMPLAPQAEEASLNDRDFNRARHPGENSRPRRRIVQNHGRIAGLRHDRAARIPVAHARNNRHAVGSVVLRKHPEVVDGLLVVLACYDLDVQEKRAGAVEGTVLDGCRVVEPFPDLLVRRESDPGRRRRRRRRLHD